MFISELNNNKEIENLLFSADQLDCAVAFIGHGAEHYFQNKKSARLVCNLTTGSTNPNTIQELKKIGVKLKNCSNLHSKVYLTPSTMIVSSSNLSANGLGLEEEEIKGWRECGVKVEDQNEIKKAQDWFDTLWSESEDITDEMIEAAKVDWKKRRAARPKNKESFAELVLSKDKRLINKQIYFTMFYEDLSKEAEKILEGLNENVEEELDAYEDWDKIPDNASLIDIFVDSENKLELTGLSRTPLNIRKEEFVNKDGELSKLVLCHPIKTIVGIPVRQKTITELNDYLLKMLEKYKSTENDGFHFSVEELMNLIQN